MELGSISGIKDMKIETPGNVDLLSMSKQYLMHIFVPFFIFIVIGRKFKSVLKNTYIGE